MSSRTVLNHCPYCGDANLWPFEAHRLASPDGALQAEDVAGAWECRSCLRAFKVTMIGQLSRPSPGGGS